MTAYGKTDFKHLTAGTKHPENKSQERQETEQEGDRREKKNSKLRGNEKKP
jgi:hypothetical protein